MKAIRVEAAQAQIVPELCIACGKCVRACPQNAKNVRDDRPVVKQALAAGRKVFASVAPSAPAFFGFKVFRQIESALEALGFSGAGETAYGAEMVGLAHKDVVQAEPARRPLITSSCPVVVNLVEKYYPDLIPHLAPVVSPMIAHGRWLREKHGPEALLVFIGPCIAKKAEIQDQAVGNVIDAALSFTELQEWMDSEGVEIPPEGGDEHIEEPRAVARLFPVEGGLVGTARMDTDLLAPRVVTTSGFEACEDVLSSIRSGEIDADLVELMACEGGCINGPDMEGRLQTAVARQRVLEYGSRRQHQALPDRHEWPIVTRAYQDKSAPAPVYAEEQIRQALLRVDKHTIEDELNCGACGYATCREKAIATLHGMAEATMCMPYMRRRAESLRQVVMDVTPDAIIIVDTRLYIQDMSPSAERMLRVRYVGSAIGKPLQTILPFIDGFATVRNTGRALLNDTVRVREDLVLEQTIVPVEGENLLMGILHDVTDRERQRAELDHLRTETLTHTNEVIKNQMRVAQEIAQLLGETTAETKMMLSRLAKLLQEGNSK